MGTIWILECFTPRTSLDCKAYFHTLKTSWISLKNYMASNEIINIWFPHFFKRKQQSWGCNLGREHLLSMHIAPGSIPVTAKTKSEKTTLQSKGKMTWKTIWKSLHSHHHYLYNFHVNFPKALLFMELKMSQKSSLKYFVNIPDNAIPSNQEFITKVSGKVNQYTSWTPSLVLAMRPKLSSNVIFFFFFILGIESKDVLSLSYMPSRVFCLFVFKTGFAKFLGTLLNCWSWPWNWDTPASASWAVINKRAPGHNWYFLCYF